MGKDMDRLEFYSNNGNLILVIKADLVEEVRRENNLSDVERREFKIYGDNGNTLDRTIVIYGSAIVALTKFSEVK